MQRPERLTLRQESNNLTVVRHIKQVENNRKNFRKTLDFTIIIVYNIDSKKDT